jgi:predicted kinase
MAELILLTGLQASGKTTFYRSRFADTHVHVSKDRLRNNANPERRQRVLIREALAAGHSVVVDNTNSTPEQRAPLIAIGRQFAARVISYYLETSVADSLRRNALRPGKQRIPDVGIYATAKRLKPPLPQEGFDELYHVRIVEDVEYDEGFEVIDAPPGGPGR